MKHWTALTELRLKVALPVPDAGRAQAQHSFWREERLSRIWLLNIPIIQRVRGRPSGQESFQVSSRQNDKKQGRLTVAIPHCHSQVLWSYFLAEGVLFRSNDDDDEDNDGNMTHKHSSATSVSSSQGCRQPVSSGLFGNNLSKVRSATARRLFIRVSAKLHRLVVTLGTLYFSLYVL